MSAPIQDSSKLDGMQTMQQSVESEWQEMLNHLAHIKSSSAALEYCFADILPFVSNFQSGLLIEQGQQLNLLQQGSQLLGNIVGYFNDFSNQDLSQPQWTDDIDGAMYDAQELNNLTSETPSLSSISSDVTQQLDNLFPAGFTFSGNNADENGTAWQNAWAPSSSYSGSQGSSALQPFNQASQQIGTDYTSVGNTEQTEMQQDSQNIQTMNTLDNMLYTAWGSMETNMTQQQNTN